MASDSSQESESSEVPEFAKKADDLEAIKKAIEDAAGVSGPLWLSYLFTMFYIALAAAGVTHLDLLLENPVELPFLTIKLPLKAFFVLAPILFLVSHAYTLTHFALLADKAKRFHELLRDKISDNYANAREIRTGLRQLLPVNMFVQFLAGPEEIREGPFSGLLWAITWVSLILSPILILLLLQLQFLPYHDNRVSWVHRVVILLDLGLIWWLWRKILSGRGTKEGAEKATQGSKEPNFPARITKPADPEWQRFKNGFLWVSGHFVARPAPIIVVFFSWWIGVYPGEWLELPYSWMPGLDWTAANAAFFGEVDAQHQKVTGAWPYNTLRLREFNVYEKLKLDDRKKFDWKEHTIDLQSRRLEYADFRDANFSKADLRGANLAGALLSGAKLQEAALDDAYLQAAFLDGAHLEGASLDGAHLEGCRFGDAYLQGASLNRAHLEGSTFFMAHLQGASLIKAHLEGVTILNAYLQGSSLQSAILEGVSLGMAWFSGSDLSGASLWRTGLGELQPLADDAAFRVANARWFPVVSAQHVGITAALDAAYAERRREIERTVLPDGAREAALEAIKRLDCKNLDKALATCDPAAPVPEAAQRLRNLIEKRARHADETYEDQRYEKELDVQLRALVCAGTQDSIHILHGIVRGGRIGWAIALDEIYPDRLAATGHEASAFVDFIESKDCPVSASLTEEDKAHLLGIKRWAEREFPQSSVRSGSDAPRAAQSRRRTNVAPSP